MRAGTRQQSGEEVEKGFWGGVVSRSVQVCPVLQHGDDVVLGGEAEGCHIAIMIEHVNYVDADDSIGACSGVVEICLRDGILV